jgi:hypothetical protein
MSAVALLCAMSFLSGFTFGTIVPGDHGREFAPDIIPPAPTLPFETRALSGVWEGVWGQRVPGRVVVERLHPEWASVFIAWGDSSRDGIPGGSLRMRAKILPDGRLHLAHPFQMTLALSDDGLNLVGTRGESDPNVSIVLRRVAPDGALAALAER